MEARSVTAAGEPEQDPLSGVAGRIGDRLGQVRRRVEDACARVGRQTASVRLLPVSKTVPVRTLRVAAGLGLTCFGENKVQEAAGKAAAMADLPVAWSVIGHLQTNKAKYVARFASEFQALDSLRVAEALDRRLAMERRGLDCLVQVNTSGEASKYGLPPERVQDFVRQLRPFEHLRIRGLMTLAVFTADLARVRSCFRLLRETRDRLRQLGPANLPLDELSMGMSADFDVGIEEGATIVRVGQAIFGTRSVPDEYYWPADSVER